MFLKSTPKKIDFVFFSKTAIFWRIFRILVSKIHRSQWNDSKICRNVFQYVYYHHAKFHYHSYTSFWEIQKI